MCCAIAVKLETWYLTVYLVILQTNSLTFNKDPKHLLFISLPHLSIDMHLKEHHQRQLPLPLSVRCWWPMAIGHLCNCYLMDCFPTLRHHMCLRREALCKFAILKAFFIFSLFISFLLFYLIFVFHFTKLQTTATICH